MSTALVLLGHGSHISPNTAAVVWEAVDTLRALGIADEITAGFWKEQPSLSRVLHTLAAADITLLPMFTAQGYFTRQVIPAEMGLDTRGAIRMTKTLGEHPKVSEIVQSRLRDALTTHWLRPDDVAVAVIGHGTKNNPASRAATESQAESLRALQLAAEVVAVYLDDDPDIPSVYALTQAPVIIAIPYFLAAGSHTSEDVPHELGLADGQTEAVIDGRRVIYTPPIGAQGGLTDILLSLIADSGMAMSARPVTSVWDGMPTAGREVFLEALAQTGQLTFGALTVTPDEVRCGDGAALPTLTTPAQVRDATRLNPFRPLMTARHMPNPWRVPLPQPEHAHAVVETAYPGVIAEWAAEQRGDFKPVQLPTVIARQQGMFRVLNDFSAESEAAYVCEVCGGCMLTPRWTRVAGGSGELPCAEPCNLFLSAAKGGLEA